MHSRNLITPIPPDTARAARATLGQNNYYLAVGDSWEVLMTERQSNAESIAEASRSSMPYILALTTLLQYKEKLSDRQAEEASRLRIDWKYALHLSLHYPGLPWVLLCRYRQKVYHDLEWQQQFQSILDRFTEQGYLPNRQEPSLTVMILLIDVCTQSRLEEAMLALRRALEVLATKHPLWLRANILPHWYTRHHLFTAASDMPRNGAQQDKLFEDIGADILYLFRAISHSDQAELSDLEEIRILQQIWREQFELAEDGNVRRLPRCSFCGSFNTSGEI